MRYGEVSGSKPEEPDIEIQEIPVVDVDGAIGNGGFGVVDVAPGGAEVPAWTDPVPAPEPVDVPAPEAPEGE